MASFIPIGILHSQNGPLAINELPLIDAALLAVKEINERGGLLGREVRPFIADGLSDDISFAKEAEGLIRDKGVCSLFGCWTSSSRKVVKKGVEHEGSLLWYPVQYEGLEQSPNIVYTGSCMNQQVAPFIEWALSKGRRRIALVGSDYVYPRTVNKLVASMVASTDACIVYENYQPLENNNFNSIIPPLSAAEPDLIINTINGVGNISFLERLLASPDLAKPDLVCSMSCTEDMFSRLSCKAEGLLACWGYFQSMESQANKAYLAKMRKLSGIVASDPIATAYSQILLWASIVDRIGSYAPGDVRTNLVGSGIDSPLGWLEIQENNHVMRNAIIGRSDAAGQFEVLWQSEAPIYPLPWVGIDKAELPFKGLIYQLLSELPEDIVLHAKLESEISMRRELALASEKNQRRLMETESIARIGGFERDLKTGEGYWSTMLFKLLGHSPGKFIPSLDAFERHVVEEDRKGFHDSFHNMMENAGTLDYQCRIRRADGEIRHVQLHAAMFMDEQGNADRYHGTLMDVTERALAEAALKEREEEMRRLAQTDELTGIFNRRRFMELTSREVDRATRYPAPFSLIMFDADKFKSVNDTYGHDSGDEVLKAIVKVSGEIAREVDILGRLGGEEFAIALPETDISGAPVVAERLRIAVEKLEIPVRGATLKCTISLGVAGLEGCANNVDTILKASDIALYRAKKNGRNRVETVGRGDLDEVCEIDAVMAPEL